MPQTDEPHRDQVLALYKWEEGKCFRCARAAVPTARITQVMASSGTYDVRACEGCVLDLEAMRRHAARNQGRPYEPGRLGESGV